MIQPQDCTPKGQILVSESYCYFRKELKKTKQILKQTEAKVKAMEEEIFEKKQEMDRLHKEARQPSQGGVSDISKLEQKLSSVEQQVRTKLLKMKIIYLI